jgi:hypothetical protein
MTNGPETLLNGLVLLIALTLPQSGLPRLASADIRKEWSRAKKKFSLCERTGEDE